MGEAIATGVMTEPQFAAMVEALSADPARQDQLTDLLQENHPVYDQRSAAAIVRMRGWILIALARGVLPDRALLFVLEELDTGVDQYLVAAAARALRSCPAPRSEFAPFVMRAISRVRYRDEPISFAGYGEYSQSTDGNSSLRELLSTLEWLGPHAKCVLVEVESLAAANSGLPKKLLVAARNVAAAIRQAQSEAESDDVELCCTLFPSLAIGRRRRRESIEQTIFEDQDGALVSYTDFFCKGPSIVVFFYSRCDNPLKCSLTVTKLGRVQSLLKARGLHDQVRTAAITYDPEFDLPARLRAYGQNRGVRMDAQNRMLRATGGVASLRNHFNLGVNFIESLVNRHRVELFVLDAQGRVAATFERVHWDERQVVDRAIAILKECAEPATEAPSEQRSIQPMHRRKLPLMFGTLASFGVAFFPKCPVCWAAYLSVFGILGLEKAPYMPWLLPLLAIVMLVNMMSVWFRARSTGRMTAFYLVGAGALAIVASRAGVGSDSARILGVGMTLAGSLLSALNLSKRQANFVRQTAPQRG